MSTTHFVTREDLALFKSELLQEIKQLITEAIKPAPPKKWIKSYQLKEMLPVSDGKLQQLRSTGALSCSIIDGLAFYDMDEVMAFMERAKHSSRKNRKYGINRQEA